MGLLAYLLDTVQNPRDLVLDTPPKPTMAGRVRAPNSEPILRTLDLLRLEPWYGRRVWYFKMPKIMAHYPKIESTGT